MRDSANQVFCIKIQHLNSNSKPDSKIMPLKNLKLLEPLARAQLRKKAQTQVVALIIAIFQPDGSFLSPARLNVRQNELPNDRNLAKEQRWLTAKGAYLRVRSSSASWVSSPAYSSGVCLTGIVMTCF